MHLFPVMPPFKLISAQKKKPVAICLYKLQLEASVAFLTVCEALSFHLVFWEEVLVTVQMRRALYRNEALFQWETFRTTEFTWRKIQERHSFCAVFENCVCTYCHLCILMGHHTPFYMCNAHTYAEDVTYLGAGIHLLFLCTPTDT